MRSTTGRFVGPSSSAFKAKLDTGQYYSKQWFLLCVEQVYSEKCGYYSLLEAKKLSNETAVAIRGGELTGVYQ